MYPLLTKHLPAFPLTLESLYNHPDFRNFGDCSDDWLSDADRMQRIHDAAENGGDGSTHAEYISDWREALTEFTREASRDAWRLDIDQVEIDALDAEIEAAEESISAEIDACETWHEANGSLYQEIG